MAKEMAYEARFVFVQPPDTEALEARLREGGWSADEARALVARAAEDLEYGRSGAFDKIIVNDNLDTAAASLEAFVYGAGENKTLTNGVPAVDRGSEGVETAEGNGATA